MTLVRPLHTFGIILKLQNHRIFKIGRDASRSSSPALMLKAGSVTGGWAEPCPVTFLYLQGWRLRNLSRNPVLVFDHLHSKSVFLCLNHVFHFVLVVSCPFTGQHWEESASIFFTPSQALTVIDALKILSINLPALDLLQAWQAVSYHVGDHEINFAGSRLDNSGCAGGKGEHRSEQRTACTAGSKGQKQCHG